MQGEGRKAELLASVRMSDEKKLTDGVKRGDVAGETVRR